MREFLAELWQAAGPDPACEFVAAVAKPYPALTISAVLGAPREERGAAARLVNLYSGSSTSAHWAPTWPGSSAPLRRCTTTPRHCWNAGLPRRPVT